MNEELENLLKETTDRGLYQMIISNPRNRDKVFKIKIRPVMLKDEILFQETRYEGTKVFHENHKSCEIIPRIIHYILEDFKQAEIEHTNEKATILVSKKGRLTIKRKHADKQDAGQNGGRHALLSHNRVKDYILKEGIPIPFLADLGVQDAEGRIHPSKYDKYKQINRFLEFVEDILPALPAEREIQIVDFGCGKSYLTFALYYYLHELKVLNAVITGLDLKTDVIEKCNALAQKYGYEKLKFLQGDIAQYEGLKAVDMVVTLHACDTATDYALAKAVFWNAKVILSVPCCQHEVNKQIVCRELEPVLQYGIIKERMSALITDALRADLLKAEGYETDLLEFIDMEHTPKNILIRAVKRNEKNPVRQKEAFGQVSEVTEFLHIQTTLQKLLEARGN